MARGSQHKTMSAIAERIAVRSGVGAHQLGDVSSGLGQPLGEMAYLYGQIRSQGRAMTQDLNQFAGRGIPIYRELAQVLRTTEAGVRDTLQRYSAALESLDASAVKKVQPSLPTETLARAFKDMRELKVAIDDVKVLSIDGTTARVSCRVMQTLTPKVGSRKTTAVTRVMRLKRGPDAWFIDGFER